MTPAELEMWAREVIGLVLSGRDVEDSRVECKREMIADHARAARQIAALANAARAPEALWIVGLDEKNRTVHDVASEDLASWWPQVAKHFDGVAPRIMERRVAIEGAVVLALLWDTADVPYVVPIGGDSDRLEVPWRDATRTRSARHGELIEILVPRLRLPTFELLDATLRVDQTPEEFRWRLGMPAYLDVAGPTIIPDHRTRARVELVMEGAEWSLDFESARIAAPTSPTREAQPEMVTRFEPNSRAATIHQDTEQLVANGPGRVTILASADLALDRPDVSRLDHLRVSVSCQPNGSDLRAEVHADLEFVELKAGVRGPSAKWQLR